MKTFLVLMSVFASVSVIQVASSRADAVLDCETREWTLTLNDKDQSTKKDLLKVIDLVGQNGGFHIKGLMSFEPCIGGRFLFIAFDPTYYTDVAQAEHIRTSVLSQLSNIHGIVVSCDARVTGDGGITGSN